jgi:putative CocE/NonD family hydrolase
MADDSIDLPPYLQAHEQRLADWRKLRATPMPMPEVPKIRPDEVVMMPMRDRIELFTELFFPNQDKSRAPTVLIRSPYPDSTFAFSARPIELFRQAGYAVAIQSCRGTWKSEGRFRFFQNEPEDGYDCVEWIARQPWSNGKIGMYGSSYLGSVQWLAAMLRPPHLTCIAPQSPGGMFFYETPYVGGVPEKHHVLTWPRLISRHSWDVLGFEWSTWLDGSSAVDRHSALYQAMSQSPITKAIRAWHAEDPDIVAALLEAFEHPTFDDWWKHIMLTPHSAGAIDIPVFAITGFHDGDQAGCLYNWDLIEGNETKAAGHRHLLIGPWRHAQMATGKTAPMGAVEFGENAEVSLPKSVLRFFDAYMKDDGAALERLPKRCRLYTSGTNRWHELSHYPPKESVETRLYLSSGGGANSIYGDGRLAFAAPNNEPPDQLPADWEMPVPSVAIGEDARTNESRYDVLIYTSAPLEDDLTVLGPVRAEIYVSVNAPDCDVIIRVEDVLPDGAAVNMTGECGFGSFRARYREGFEREVLLQPDEPARLSFHVCHMGHVFKREHRVRVAICATVANWLEPNHHTGEPVAAAVERRKAVEKIFHDAARPSHVVLPVIPFSNT